MRRQLLHWSIFIFIFLFAFGTVGNPWSSRYIHDLKQQSIPVLKKNDNKLHEKIQAAARKYNEPASNAKIDKVWKAIPGYNGIKVDLEASYQKMKPGGYDKDKLVFKEVKPDVHLNELPPSPIYRGNPNKPKVSLMVNVAWGNKYLSKILKVMKTEHIHATFFLDGSWVKKNPDLAKIIAEEGHEIGNHAYSHPDMKAMPTAAIRREIQKTNIVIRATLGKTPKLFAPPSGSYNTNVVNIAHNLGMKTILWTADTVDWKKPQASEMAQRVLRQVHAGTMILMHPTSSTAEGLKTMIDGIRNRGYQIGTVSSLLSEKRL